MLFKWCDRLAIASAPLLVGCLVFNGLSIREARQPQHLPVEAKLLFGKKVINLEVARTAAEQAKGLMFRRDPLLPNQGMLFPIEPPRKVVLWMKDVQQPLDILFLRHGLVLDILSSVPPCRSNFCPLLGINAVLDRIVELPANTAYNLGINKNSILQIQESQSP